MDAYKADWLFNQAVHGEEDPLAIFEKELTCLDEEKAGAFAYDRMKNCIEALRKLAENAIDKDDGSPKRKKERNNQLIAIQFDEAYELGTYVHDLHFYCVGPNYPPHTMAQRNKAIETAFYLAGQYEVQYATPGDDGKPPKTALQIALDGEAVQNLLWFKDMADLKNKQWLEGPIVWNFDKAREVARVNKELTIDLMKKAFPDEWEVRARFIECPISFSVYARAAG